MSFGVNDLAISDEVDADDDDDDDDGFGDDCDNGDGREDGDAGGDHGNDTGKARVSSLGVHFRSLSSKSILQS